MHLLSQIEGKSNENLASALLTYILQRSPEARHESLKVIQAAWTRDALNMEHSFSARTEVGTLDQAEGPGRIDILLKLDNAVVGIEVKFGALFQTGQPAKYRPTLQTFADAEAAVTGPKCLVIALLVPRARKREAEQHLTAQNIQNAACVVEWEKLVDRLRAVRTVDPAALFLIEELYQFVQHAVGGRQELDALLPILRRDLADVDDNKHSDFVAWLFWPAFHNPALGDVRTRLSRSKGFYVGYYFLMGLEPHYGWYGFVPSRFIEGRTDRASEFVVALDKAFPMPQLDPSRVTQIKISKPGTGMENQQVWQVNLDESLGDPAEWRRLLEPLHRRIEELHAQREAAKLALPAILVRDPGGDPQQ